jgi:hypothetical protein
VRVAHTQRGKPALTATMAGKLWNEDAFCFDPGQKLLVRTSLKRQAVHAAGAGILCRYAGHRPSAPGRGAAC